MTAHYVYRCYSADRRLLYVGQSKDWANRLETHRRTAFWAGDVARVQVCVYRSPEAARAAERKAIRTEHPRFNYQGRWEVRSIWPNRQDWIDYITAATAGRYSNRQHLETVFRAYAAVFNEVHPMAQRLRREWAEHDDRMAVEHARRTVLNDIQRRRLEAADRLSMLDHFETCTVCATEGRYSDVCPELLADLNDDGEVAL